MMPEKTDKTFINIQIPTEMLNWIDDYRFKNRIQSRAEAVRQLIEKALGAPQKETSKK
ncbi:MAG: hypothetical protein HRF42_01690 [Candidatus Brocadia sp.]|jgi:metal-responsive CopG/Arc/MetJ family transcriptional regulator